LINYDYDSGAEWEEEEEGNLLLQYVIKDQKMNGIFKNR
jgi:hypothetical protein